MLYCITRKNNKVTTTLYDKNQKFDRTELLFICQKQMITQKDIASIIIASRDFQKLHISGFTLQNSIYILANLLNNNNGNLKEVLVKPLPYDPSLNHHFLYELYTNSLKLIIFTQTTMYCDLIYNFIKSSRIINTATITSENISLPNTLTNIQNQLNSSVIEANNNAINDILTNISKTANIQSNILKKASTPDDQYRLRNEFTRMSFPSILSFLPDQYKSNPNSIFFCEDTTKKGTHIENIDTGALTNLGEKIKSYHSKEDLPLSLIISRSR